MFVSFVIPTRNHAPFLRRCIDSCLAQELPDAEVVVVDGLSSDGTREILVSYGERVRWVSEPDEGQSDALNKGVRLAAGEMIAWINSDDYYPDATVLRRVTGFFEEVPDLDVVYGDGLMVDVRGQPIRPTPGRPLPSLKHMLLYPSGFALQPAVFFRKRLYDEVGGVSTQLHWAMDYDLWLRLLPRARKVRYVPACLAYATYHEGAKSVRGLRSQVLELCAIKKRYAPAFSLQPSERLRMWLGMANLHLYWISVKLGLRRVV
jgi:glycosyltransferase involved in cell wall biosynthesis